MKKTETDNRDLLVLVCKKTQSGAIRWRKAIHAYTATYNNCDLRVTCDSHVLDGRNHPHYHLWLDGVKLECGSPALGLATDLYDAAQNQVWAYNRAAAEEKRRLERLKQTRTLEQARRKILDK